MSQKLLSISCILCAFFAYSSEAAGAPKDPGLIEEVVPNFDAVKGLICYQCRSNTSELQPLCDEALFKLTTKQEKLNMSLQCPHYQGAYCFTQIKKHGKHIQTTRGCSGPTDKNDNLMKVGCMTKRREGRKEVLCLCDTKFCNRAETEKFLSENQVSAIFAISIVFLSSKLHFL